MADHVTWEAPAAPSTRFGLEARLVSQSVAANASLLEIYLNAVNLGNSSSNFTGAGVQAAYARNRLGTVVDIANYSATPFLPSGYGTGAQRWRTGPHYVTIQHLDDGRAPVNMTAGRRGISIGQNLVYGSYDVAVEAALVVPTIVRSIVRAGVDDDWIDCIPAAGINNQWVPVIAAAGVDDAWTPLALT